MNLRQLDKIISMRNKDEKLIPIVLGEEDQLLDPQFEINRHMVTLDANDTIITMADKIFNHFLVTQSCTIRGFEKDVDDNVELKGDRVLELLREMDRKQNYINHNKSRNDARRRRHIPKDSIGGYLAHKIFKFKHETLGTPCVTIWRIQ